MNLMHVGDSYDIVKQSLLRVLAPLGPWFAHPMFSAPFTQTEAAAFGALLDVPLLSTEVLSQHADRAAYFASARACSGHLFLDPDTGIRMKRTRGKKAPAYLFMIELAEIARRDADLVTMSFDQCLPRGAEAGSLRKKLDWLASSGLHGFAYQSHASFVLAGCNLAVIKEARRILECQAHLPARRFIEV